MLPQVPKVPPLSHIKLKGQIFRNNIPRGYFTNQTGAQGRFSIENDFSSHDHVEIIDLQGEAALKVICKAHSTLSVRKILIECTLIRALVP